MFHRTHLSPMADDLGFGVTHAGQWLGAGFGVTGSGVLGPLVSGSPRIHLSPMADDLGFGVTHAGQGRCRGVVTHDPHPLVSEADPGGDTPTPSKPWCPTPVPPGCRICAPSWPLLGLWPLVGVMGLGWGLRASGGF
jgi:hypothetical protein